MKGMEKRPLSELDQSSLPSLSSFLHFWRDALVTFREMINVGGDRHTNYPDHYTLYTCTEMLHCTL
jgi:hypothetical protein